MRRAGISLPAACRGIAFLSTIDIVLPAREQPLPLNVRGSTGQFLDRNMNDATMTYRQMFSGKRLLIVEDGYFLSEEARQKLQELGATLLGPVSTAEDALELIKGKNVDAVILDLHLDAGFVFPIVETLQRLKLPYLFAIGHEPPIVPAGFTGFILCDKAAEIEHIGKALFGRRKRDLYLV